MPAAGTPPDEILRREDKQRDRVLVAAKLRGIYLNKLLLSMTAAVGLLLAASPAKALTLTATPSDPLASGSYTVIVTPTGGATYSISVQGNNDGRVVADASGPAKHSVGRISVGFFGPNFDPIEPLSGSGSTTSGGSYVGAAFTTIVQTDVIRFNSPSETNDVGPFGENIFLGNVTLNSPQTPQLFTVALQDGTQQWFASGELDVVPEPASLALALPGLLPVGMMLLRRRRKGDAENAELN